MSRLSASSADPHRSAPTDYSSYRFPANINQEALSRYYAEIQQVERTLDDMANTKLDESFREELTAIEQWFMCLTEVERTTSLYTLFQYLSPVQIRFFMTILQQMARRIDPTHTLFSPIGSERGDSRPSSMIDDLAAPINGDLLNDKLYSAMQRGNVSHSSATRRLFDRHSVNLSDTEQALRNLDLTDRNGVAGRPKSISEADYLHQRPLSLDSDTPSPKWNSRNSENTLINSAAKIFESLVAPVPSHVNSDLQPCHFAGGGRHSRPSSPSPHHLARPISPMPRPTSPAPIGPPSRPISPMPLSNPAALATGHYYSETNSALPAPSIAKDSSYITANSNQKRQNRDHERERESSSKSEGKDVDLALLEDIPAWLRSLRLHKYTALFEGMTWRDMIDLTDENLATLGVSALGARTKFLKTFAAIKRESEKTGLL